MSHEAEDRCRDLSEASLSTTLGPVVFLVSKSKRRLFSYRKNNYMQVQK